MLASSRWTEAQGAGGGGSVVPVSVSHADLMEWSHRAMTKLQNCHDTNNNKSYFVGGTTVHAAGDPSGGGGGHSLKADFYSFLGVGPGAHANSSDSSKSQRTDVVRGGRGSTDETSAMLNIPLDQLMRGIQRGFLFESQGEVDAAETAIKRGGDLTTSSATGTCEDVSAASVVTGTTSSHHVLPVAVVVSSTTTNASTNSLMNSSSDTEKTAVTTQRSRKENLPEEWKRDDGEDDSSDAESSETNSLGNCIVEAFERRQKISNGEQQQASSSSRKKRKELHSLGLSSTIDATLSMFHDAVVECNATSSKVDLANLRSQLEVTAQELRSYEGGGKVAAGGGSCFNFLISIRCNSSCSKVGSEEATMLQAILAEILAFRTVQRAKSYAANISLAVRVLLRVEDKLTMYRLAELVRQQPISSDCLVKTFDLQPNSPTVLSAVLYEVLQRAPVLLTEESLNMIRQSWHAQGQVRDVVSCLSRLLAENKYLSRLAGVMEHDRNLIMTGETPGRSVVKDRMLMARSQSFAPQHAGDNRARSESVISKMRRGSAVPFSPSGKTHQDPVVQKEGEQEEENGVGDTENKMDKNNALVDPTPFRPTVHVSCSQGREMSRRSHGGTHGKTITSSAATRSPSLWNDHCVAVVATLQRQAALTASRVVAGAQSHGNGNHTSSPSSSRQGGDGVPPQQRRSQTSTGTAATTAQQIPTVGTEVSRYEREVDIFGALYATAIHTFKAHYDQQQERLKENISKKDNPKTKKTTLEFGRLSTSAYGTWENFLSRFSKHDRNILEESMPEVYWVSPLNSFWHKTGTCDGAFRDGTLSQKGGSSSSSDAGAGERIPLPVLAPLTHERMLAAELSGLATTADTIMWPTMACPQGYLGEEILSIIGSGIAPPGTSANMMRKSLRQKRNRTQADVHQAVTAALTKLGDLATKSNEPENKAGSAAVPVATVTTATTTSSVVDKKTANRTGGQSPLAEADEHSPEDLFLSEEGDLLGKGVLNFFSSDVSDAARVLYCVNYCGGSQHAVSFERVQTNMCAHMDDRRFATALRELKQAQLIAINPAKKTLRLVQR